MIALDLHPCEDNVKRYCSYRIIPYTAFYHVVSSIIFIISVWLLMKYIKHKILSI